MSICTNCRLPADTGKNNSENLCNSCKKVIEGDPGIQLTSIERNDLELVLAWRSNPEIYRHFRQQEGPLNWDEHIAWFESRADDRYDFVIHYDGRRVGVVNINQQDEVGIYIGEFSARGTGTATKALKWLCDRFAERVPLFAEIHKNNDVSKRLFHRCGFQQKNSDGEWLIYIYDL